MPCHKELLFNWRNDEEIYKWCRQNDTLEWNSHSKWFDSIGNDPKIKMYLIKLEDTPVGVCGLTDIDLLNRRAEFSIYVSRDNWFKGCGKLALIKLLGKGFHNYGLNVIWGETFDGNPAASTFTNLGFSLEGTRRQFYYREGKFIDAKLYSITRDEFYGRASTNT